MSAQILVDGQTPCSLTRDRYLLGRGEECGLLLPEDDASLSRRHAVLERSPDGGWSVTDLGSRNGTFVNGARIYQRRRLCDGDVLRLGRTEARMTLPGQGAATPPSSGAARQRQTLVSPALAEPAVAAMPPPPAPQASVAHQAGSAGATPLPAPGTVPPPPPAAERQPAGPSKPPALSWSVPSSAAPVTPHPVRPAASGLDVGTCLIGVGGGLMVVCALLYFVHFRPVLDQYQSGLGQLAMGLSALTGRGGLEGQYRSVVIQSQACVGGGILGLALLVVGLIKRR